MEDFEIEITETKSTTTGAKIKAIGVGGGGGNMINHMINEGIHSIDLIVANTDQQALDSSIAPYKMQLGINATRGLGAGMVPEKGREAALESFEDIKSMLSGSDIVFISAGLGGGTGTGAAPIIAQAAKEVGALTVSVVTSPFKFEGRKRAKLAKEGLEELKRESDSIIVVPNEKLLSIVEKNLGIKESFRMVDDILAQAVGGISKVILSHGENDINLDFADVKTVMSHRGLALMGAGYATGTNAAYDAAKAAIESPLLDNISIDGAMGVLVHFDIHPDYPIMEIGEAMGIVEESADEDASVIFGTTTNENMEPDEVKITIVATGFEDKDAMSEPTVKKQETLLSSGTTTNNLNNLRSNMVVGGYNDNEDILGVPTFLRKQMD
jgi:cell division protein FtsZ